MPQITITLTIDIPEGASVRVNQGGRSNTPPPSFPGAASESQRRLIYARCKQGGVDLGAVLAQIGIAELDELRWKQMDDALRIIEELRQANGGTPAPDSMPEVSDDEIPF